MSKKQYLKPKDFIAEYKVSQEKGEPTNKLLKMFERIAIEYSSVFGNNVNKLDRDSCINYALTEAWKKWKKFNEERSTNIFAFFTQMIKNDLTAHYNTINKNKKRNISLDAIFQNNANK